jgi:membrane-bound serine protease (ClpP class)
LGFAEDEEKAAHVISIHGDIDAGMASHVRRQAGEALEAGAAFLVFDIDTFGGRVDSALQISSFIGSVRGAQTVAFVRSSPEGMGVSWSAGALIAMSSSAIYMAPGTSIGAAAPVIMEPGGGAVSAGEKSVSAVRSQLAALAEKNGHPVPLALAMVDSDVVVVEVEVDGALRAVLEEEASRLERERPGRVKRGSVISPKGKLLSLTAGEALRYGLSRGTVADFPELLAVIGASRQTVSPEISFTDELAAFLSRDFVRVLLIVIGLVALFMEISTPGFGVPGTVAIVAFAALFGTGGALGTLGALEVFLFLAGVVLLVLEIFVVPGFGAAGIGGVILIGVSLVFSMQDFVVPEGSLQWDVLYRNILTVSGGLIAGVAGICVLALFAPRLKLFDRFTLKTVLGASPAGGAAGGAGIEGGGVGGAGILGQGEAEGLSLVGMRGAAVSVLRPSGRAEFGGSVYSVEADGAFIPAGTPLVVVSVQGGRILVKSV